MSPPGRPKGESLSAQREGSPMTPERIAAQVDAAAALLDLPLAPEHRPGVLRYFALAAGFAAQLEAIELQPHDEPAVQFTPLA
jgi:hypothetical protein